MKERDRFKKIYIEISNICNLDCGFCLKTNREKRSLSINEFQLILNKVKPYTEYLYFHVLGEPLLHKDINEFIDMASKDFFVNITSNGYLINNIKTKNIRQINISLHSFDEKYHKSLDNYLEDIYKFIINNKNNTYINLRLWVNNKNSDNIIKFFEEKFNTKINKNSNNILDKNVFFNFDNEFVWPENGVEQTEHNMTCYALKDHIAILSNGVVTSCCLDGSGKINFGNIFKDDLDKIINSKLFEDMLNNFKNNKRIHPLCKKCNFMEIKQKN